MYPSLGVSYLLKLCGRSVVSAATKIEWDQFSGSEMLGQDGAELKSQGKFKEIGSVMGLRGF